MVNKQYEEWFVQEVEDGLEELKKGEIAASEEVAARFHRWGVAVDSAVDNAD